jgi:hypothetical protein
MMSDDLLIAAKRIDTAAQSLSSGYTALEEALAKFRRAAWQKGGSNGTDDVNARGAGQDRAAREVIGVLLGAGLGDLFDRAGVHLHSFETVTEPLTSRYVKRLQGDAFTTTRTVA